MALRWSPLARSSPRRRLAGSRATAPTRADYKLGLEVEPSFCLSGDVVQQIVEAHESVPGLVSSCGDDALDEELFKVFLTSALPDLVSKGDELIFSRRIFFIPPGVGAGKASLPFGGSVVEQQIVAS